VTFVPSIHQQNLFNWIANGKGSANVIAVAGSGKSTSLEKALPFIPEGSSVLGLAFNASIAKEWKEVRLPRLRGDGGGRAFSKVEFKTFHSLGFGAILKKLGVKSSQMTTDSNKMRLLARETLGEIDLDTYGSFACRLVGLAKGEGIGALVPDTEDRWWEIVNHHDLSLDGEGDEEEAIGIARGLLRRSSEVAKTNRLIDFDDMIYLPLLWRLRLWQHDWVMVDELQDTNPARRALAKLALRPGGRFLGVGDPNQGIYGFTGATTDAMDLVRDEFSCKELPLSVCYRCARSVVQYAQDFVPQIEAAPNAQEGSVTFGVPTDQAIAKLGPQDAILCRNVAPLVKCAYNLIGRGVGCSILGREIGDGLVNLIKKQRARDIDRLLIKLQAYREREEAKFVARGQDSKAEAVNDRVASIEAVVAHLHENDRTIPKLIARIEAMFTDTNGVLTLSTVHKAKGKEWDNVAILEPDLMPSRWARSAWAQQQERNLQYVAATRARINLIYMTSTPRPVKEDGDL
jgi:ATP-dependent DNA helicase UvrD/PcrA